MKINITTIKRERGASCDFSFSTLPKQLVVEELADVFTSEVCVHGKVTNLGTSLLVVGNILTSTKNICARCLKELTQKLEIDFSEEFVSSKGETIEEGVYTYQEEFLKLADLVNELLLLELPMKSLCDNQCKGLCPTCGTDLNLSACDCINISINPKLLALKDYRFN